MLAVLVVLVAGFVWFMLANQTFWLPDAAYEASALDEIGTPGLDEMLEKKESFVALVYQPACETSANFEEVVDKFLTNYALKIYKVAFSELKDSRLGETVKYYPSFLVVRKGELVGYLDANSDEDLPHYESEEGFRAWLTRYIKLKPAERTDYNNAATGQGSTMPDVDLSNVTKEKGKVNVYFFYGQGCPHCAKEHEFWQSIEEEYGDMYNIYTFETWYNEDNNRLMKVFGEAMGDTVKGVPYTVVGEKGFIGFAESQGNNIIAAIKEYHHQDFDVYLDKIKNAETEKKDE